MKLTYYSENQSFPYLTLAYREQFRSLLFEIRIVKIMDHLSLFY